MRPGCIVVSRAPGREILLRLRYLLRVNELSQTRTACRDAKVLPNGRETEKFRANQNVRLFRLSQRIFGQFHSAL